MLHDLVHRFVEYGFYYVHEWGYGGVVILMAMESSIFPVPSEVVVPPAAILAAHGGDMTLTGVVIAGTAGSWLGSAITYWVSMLVGRPIIMRYGRWLLMPPEKVERAERFMHRYEGAAIFFARLLPVLRHLISIPAGIIRMGFLKFSILTTIGAAIWCSVLAWLGGRVGEKLTPAQITALKAGKDVDLDGLIGAVKAEALWIIIAIALVCILYFTGMKLTGKTEHPKTAVCQD